MKTDEPVLQPCEPGQQCAVFQHSLPASRGCAVCPLKGVVDALSKRQWCKNPGQPCEVICMSCAHQKWQAEDVEHEALKVKADNPSASVVVMAAAVSWHRVQLIDAEGQMWMDVRVCLPVDMFAGKAYEFRAGTCRVVVLPF